MLDPQSLFYEIAQSNEVLKIFESHSLRVMHLTSMLGQTTNCYDEDLRVAALLHDIGKIGVAKEILFKPHKLNSLEYTIVQSHSHIGNTIVRNELGMTRAAGFIRDHHERWDGTGYPRRLVGDECSYQGRIIGICDAFDTMTLDRRHYNLNTLSYEEAFVELRRCSWTQFDGDLVEAFISTIKKFNLPEEWFRKETVLRKIYSQVDISNKIYIK